VDVQVSDEFHKGKDYLSPRRQERQELICLGQKTHWHVFHFAIPAPLREMMFIKVGMGASG
jgi:hypothetical protein